MDELLENKEQLADFVLTKLKTHKEECFVTFFDAGVKDMSLPGDLLGQLAGIMKGTIT